ncbi:Ion-translocating oxidoreductase complex subunit B [Methanimicrococcus sp. At1]|uniref:Coenzyme F420 hydrogenase subunit gamma n=2 Tax=Methanimicrococcus hacksteinii TaxID=3028293 RepID=A0ABU3VMN1_9EURY|nr:Ion-translocating oxidoreductase complex subunit B [Methanimicrococcus sp. At1]
MSGCTGCLISFADTYEKLLDILGAVDLVYAITLADAVTKVTETEDKLVIERVYPDEVDIALVEGSICLDDPHAVELIKEVREKSKVVVSLGACAATGGVTRFGRGGQNPQPTHVSFVPVAEVVKVDFAIPGCPPSTDAIVKFLMAALEGDTDYLEMYAEFVKYQDASGENLIKQVISQGLCMGCGTCAAACQMRAVAMYDGKPDVRMEMCINCGSCVLQCPRIRMPKSKGLLEV